MAKIPTEDLQVKALLDEIEKSGQRVVQGGELIVEAVPTGIPSFDMSTGIGGFPRGRVSIVQGEEGSGKTLLALATIANTQRSGGRAAFIDAEHALTPSFAQLLGVDYDQLFRSLPRTLNDAYDVGRPLAASGLFDVIVFDSAVALSTADMLDKSASDGSQRASEAQIHSQELKKLISAISDRTAFIIINQMRENPNPPVWARGKQLYSPGGRGLKHASSLTVDVSVGERYEKSGVRIGQLTKTFVSKNKVGTPYKRAEFKLMYQDGLDVSTSVIDTALEFGVIRRSGSTYYFDVFDPTSGEVERELKWAGRIKMEEAFKNDEQLMEVLAEYVSQATEQEDE